MEVRPLRQITGESEFNQVGLHEVFVPEDCLVGGLHQGWGVASTTLAHERGTAYPFKEQVVHEIYFDELVADDRARAALGDPVIADDLVDAYVALRLLRLRNYRTLSDLGRGVEPGPDSSVTELIHSSMTRRLSAVALDVLGVEAPLGPSRSRTWPRALGSVSGCGRRPPRSRAAPTRYSARSSPSVFWAFPGDELRMMRFVERRAPIR